MFLIITLIILGIILLLIEILLIPGIAVVGVLGLASLAGSCYFAFQEYGEVGGVITIAVNILLLVLFTIYSLKSKTWKKLSLNTNIDSKTDQMPEEKGIVVGDEGITITRLSPMGKATINNKALEVAARDNIIDANVKVRVVLIDGNKIYVQIIN